MTPASECKPLPESWRDCADRFWSHIDRSSDLDACWLWTGSTFDFGHGCFSLRIGPDRWRNVRAHRIAWALANGADPAPLYVLHRCDVPACCNPAHLFTGSKRDNSLDMATKGRGGRPRIDVCRAGLHDLTDPANVKIKPDRYSTRVCVPCERHARRERYRLTGK